MPPLQHTGSGHNPRADKCGRRARVAVTSARLSHRCVCACARSAVAVELCHHCSGHAGGCDGGHHLASLNRCMCQHQRTLAVGGGPHQVTRQQGAALPSQQGQHLRMGMRGRQLLNMIYHSRKHKIVVLGMPWRPIYDNLWFPENPVPNIKF